MSTPGALRLDSLSLDYGRARYRSHVACLWRKSLPAARAALAKRRRLARRRALCPQCGRAPGGVKALPFSLSDEQEAAVEDILGDMCDADRVMNRLLLGDVGTGKTAVAASRLPSRRIRVLSRALWRLRACLRVNMPIRPALALAGWYFLGAPHRFHVGVGARAIHAQLASGELDVVFWYPCGPFGRLAFRHLSLVVIDEQHRFGVGQRNVLRGKGLAPTLLVMTATPIPRTLALSVYGDLDTSIIRHRPVPGAGRFDGRARERQPRYRVWGGSRCPGPGPAGLRHLPDGLSARPARAGRRRSRARH